MADLGICNGCKKKHQNRTHICRHCQSKVCTRCTNTSPKCPGCGKAAWRKPNR